MNSKDFGMSCSRSQPQAMASYGKVPPPGLWQSFPAIQPEGCRPVLECTDGGIWPALLLLPSCPFVRYPTWVCSCALGRMSVEGKERKSDPDGKSVARVVQAPELGMRARRLLRCQTPRHSFFLVSPRGQLFFSDITDVLSLQYMEIL